MRMNRIGIAHLFINVHVIVGIQRRRLVLGLSF